MDRLDRIEKVLDKLAESQAEADRQRIKDRAEAKATAKRRALEDKRRALENKRRQDEWERRDAELSKKIADVSAQVGGQANRIGEITEAMTVSDNIIDLVNEFDGIDVEYFAFNITKKYPAKNSQGKTILKQHEVDGLAEGKKVAVVIEAKTSLRKDYVEDFIEKLAKFKLAYPDQRHKDLYGAVTFVRADNSALELAKEHGLFILKASPPDVELINDEGFEPAKFV